MASFASPGNHKEFSRNQEVWYKKRDASTPPVKATIVARHEDNFPDIYYTLKFEDGKEKQTDRKNLFHSKPETDGNGARELPFTPFNPDDPYEGFVKTSALGDAFRTSGGGGGAASPNKASGESNSAPSDVKSCGTNKSGVADPSPASEVNGNNTNGSILIAYLVELDSILLDIGTDMKNCEVIATVAFENIKICIEQCAEIFDNKFKFSIESAEKRCCFTKIQSLENKQALLRHLIGLIKAGFDESFSGSPRTVARVAERRKEITLQFKAAIGDDEKGAWKGGDGMAYLDSCMAVANDAIASTKAELRESLTRIKNKITSTVMLFDKKMDAIRERSSGSLEDSSERRKFSVKLELFNGREQLVELILKILA